MGHFAGSEPGIVAKRQSNKWAINMFMKIQDFARWAIFPTAWFLISLVVNYNMIRTLFGQVAVYVARSMILLWATIRGLLEDVA